MFDALSWRVSIVENGREREPVVAIDSFAAAPSVLIEEAASLRFTAASPYYPGVRAEVPVATANAMSAALAHLCARVFGAAPRLEGCFYSLVTTPAAALSPIQRLPHYDGVEPERLALILYLCDPNHGGTCFYRHRSTGFETVSEQRFAAYRDALAADVRRHGLPSPAYIAGDTPLFERIAAPPPAFNRALVYRGHNLHSGDIGPGFAGDPNPRTGRLTVTAFFV